MSWVIIFIYRKVVFQVKKRTVVILVTCLALGFTGCGVTNKGSTEKAEAQEKENRESKFLKDYFDCLNKADFTTAMYYTQNEDIFKLISVSTSDTDLNYSLTEIGEVTYNTMVEELCKNTVFKVGDYVDTTSGGTFEYTCTVEVPKPTLSKAQKKDFKKRLKKKVNKYYTGEVNDEELNRYILKLVKSTIKTSYEGAKKDKITLTLGETNKDGNPTVAYASQMTKKMFLSANLTGYVEGLSKLATSSLEATIKD